MDPWPWLAVAAAGALHGLNPVTGWGLAACSGSLHGTRVLLPMVLGHLASVIVVAAAVPAALQLGVEFDPRVLLGVAAAALLVSAVRRRLAPTTLAVWSFIVATAHGTGWMLLPALASLCASDMPAKEITASGSLGLALAALGVHLAAMFAVTMAMAAGARRGFAAARQRLASPSRPGAG